MAEAIKFKLYYEPLESEPKEKRKRRFTWRGR